MSTLASLYVAASQWLWATPSPTETGKNLSDPVDVSPGLAGFVATFIVVLVTIVLILDMNRRVRRLNYRKQQQADAAAEQEQPPRGTQNRG